MAAKEPQKKDIKDPEPMPEVLKDIKKGERKERDDPRDISK